MERGREVLRGWDWGRGWFEEVEGEEDGEGMVGG